MMRNAAVLLMAVGCAAQCDVGTAMCGGIGALQCKEGFACAPAGCDPLTTSDCSGCCLDCTTIKTAFDSYLTDIQTCTTADQCGTPLTGTSCGCTRNLVARADLSKELLEGFHALKGLYQQCGGNFISTCDCPASQGFKCDAGKCAYNLDVAPVSNKCETDATCPEGTWCRAVHDTASGQGCLVGKECVPFVQKGETCGGFVLPCYHDQCAAGLECECSEPTCDVPGTCVDATPAFCADKGPFCGRGFDECKPGYTCTFDPTCTPDEIATDRCSSCCVRDEPAFCTDKGPVCGAGLEECKEGYTCTVDPTCTTGECASCCVLDEPSFCDDKGPFCGRGFDECKPGYTCTFDPTCTPDEIATDRCSSCCVRDEPAFCADKGPVCGAGLEKCKEGYTCTVDPTCTGKDCGSCCVFDEVTPCCLAHPVCKEGFTQKKKAKCNSKDEKKCYIEELCCKKIACRRIKKGWDQYIEFGHDEE